MMLTAGTPKHYQKIIALSHEKYEDAEDPLDDYWYPPWSWSPTRWDRWEGTLAAVDIEYTIQDVLREEIRKEEMGKEKKRMLQSVKSAIRVADFPSEVECLLDFHESEWDWETRYGHLILRKRENGQ